MIFDFSLGDQVTAMTLDSRSVAGVTCGLDFGQGDSIAYAYVLTDAKDGSTMVAVDPTTLRYQVDRNGYWFRLDPKFKTLLVGRNDELLADPAWVRRKGAELLFRSMHPKAGRRVTR